MGLDPVRNWATASLTAGIGIADTTFSVGGGEGTLFPAPASEGAYNVVIFNATDYTDPILDPNHEIIRVTARATDAFTVTRAQESTTAVTHNTAAKTYKIVLAPTRKLIQDIDARLTDQTQSYAADTGAADAYVITLSPAPTAYAAGQAFRFKATNANTGASTINVNGLGAKSIKANNGGSALAAGQIAAGDIVAISYDGTDFRMITSIALATVQNAAFVYGTTGGSANAHTLTLSPAFTGYAAGQRVVFKAGYTNTAAATINISALGTKAIVDREGSALVGGEIVANGVYTATYDGTSFLLDGILTAAQARVNTGAGFGSTNICIRRIETTDLITGSDVTVAHSATLGTTFTVNKAGLYYIRYQDVNANGSFGISLNSSQLSTTIPNITAADNLGYFSTGVGVAAEVTRVRRLAVGDIIRPHGDTLQTTTTSCTFEMIRIG